jgi:hypothetical protein
MHHHRRKSGHASGNSSLTDVRKAVGSTDPSAKKHSSRPAAMTRRTTPQSVPKLGRNPRDREKEWEEERWWDEERESIPQFWYVIPTTTTTLPCFFLPRFTNRSCTALGRLAPPLPLTGLPSPSSCIRHLACRRSVSPRNTRVSTGQEGRAGETGWRPISVDLFSMVPESAVPALLLPPHIPAAREKPQADRLAVSCCSMICEKQFVPSDDQYLYCSEE